MTLGREAWDALREVGGDPRRLRNENPQAYIRYVSSIRRATHLDLGFSTDIQRQWFNLRQRGQADTWAKTAMKFMPFLLARTRAALGPIGAAHRSSSPPGYAATIWRHKLEAAVTGMAMMTLAAYAFDSAKGKKADGRDMVKYIGGGIAYSDVVGIAGDFALVGADLYRKTGNVDIDQLNIEVLGGLASGVHILSRIVVGGAGKAAWAPFASPAAKTEADVIYALRTYAPWTDIHAGIGNVLVDEFKPGGFTRRPLRENRRNQFFSARTAANIALPITPPPTKASRRKNPFDFSDFAPAYRDLKRTVRRAARD